MVSGQIFGVKNSQATCAAERFFKARRTVIQFVDLKQKPMAAGGPKRFIERFGVAGLLGTAGKAHVDAVVKCLTVSDSKLLRLPLIHAANRLSVGHAPRLVGRVTVADPI
jgi:arsenate reductase-like glutaredoxin family protein